MIPDSEKQGLFRDWQRQIAGALNTFWDGPTKRLRADRLTLTKNDGDRGYIEGSDAFGTDSLNIAADDVITIQGTTVNIGTAVAVGGRSFIPIGSSVAGTVTNQTNWSVTVNQARPIGPLAYLDITVERTTSTFNSTGTNTQLATLGGTNGARGTLNQSIPIPLMDSATYPVTGHAVVVFNPSTGVLTLTRLSDNWTAGATLRFSGVIPVSA